MNSKIAKKIEKIEQLRTQISSLPPLTKDVEKKLWDKFRLEWNYNSNHIEGNTISYVEAKQFLINQIKESFHTDREWEEMTGHNLAVETIKEWASNTEQPLNESDIRSLHTMILVKNYWSDAVTPDGKKTKREIVVGDYKSFPNSVITNNGEIFHYTDPMNVPAEMKELIEWYRTSTNDHPIIKATDFHYKFIRIHPFDDGNGRLARLLLNYELLANGYPPVIIKSVDKKKYLNCLQAADSDNFEPFYEFISDCLLWSLELVLKAHNNESLEEPDDLEKEISLFKKKIKAKQNVDNLNLTPEQVKLQVIRQVEEFYIPFIDSLSFQFNKQFGDLFSSISILQYNREHGKFDETSSVKDFLLVNFQVNTFSNFEYAFNIDVSLSKPQYTTPKTILSSRLLILFKNSTIQVFFGNFANPLEQWNITDTITDEERDELVKVVVKSIFEQIQKSIEV